VVVGVDGSSASDRALDWAAAEAVRHEARLTILSAYVAPPSAAWTSYGAGGDSSRTEAEDAVGTAMRRLDQARVRGIVPVPACDDVEARAVRSTAASALVQSSVSSDLVVVGRRGLAAHGRPVLGSVSSAVAAMAGGPVAVVPDDTDVGPVWEVVAGVGPDEGAGRVLSLAFEKAERTAAPLSIVHALEPDGVARLMGDPVWANRYEDDVTASLRAEAARWAEKYPTVQWSLRVQTGHAVEVLRRRLDRHTIVVVGGRRRAPLAGPILGSVPDQLVRHAPCPVVVAHERW
jgi:nucleotide-binding universal stress UspA family protein